MSDCNGQNLILLLYFCLLFTPTIHHAIIKELVAKHDVMKIFLKHTRMTKHKISAHYANTPMQYIAIFHGCKNDK